MPAEPPPATPGDDDLDDIMHDWRLDAADPLERIRHGTYLDDGLVLVAEVERLRAELARRDAALAAVAHLGRCWAALCRCTDEFELDYPDACAEHEQALYGAVEAVIAATGAGQEEGS
jgi:hypothetical protein